MWSMEQGPALGEVMDCIKGKRGSRHWAKLIGPKDANHVIRLVENEFSTEELSDYELELLEQVNSEHGQLSDAVLLDFVHGLREYTQTAKGRRFPILVEKILSVENVPKSRVEDIRALADEIALAKRAGAIAP